VLRAGGGLFYATTIMSTLADSIPAAGHLHPCPNGHVHTFALSHPRVQV